jgi:hypothetical protein
MNRRLCFLALLAGCVAPLNPVAVEVYEPSAIVRAEPTEILHPTGRTYALDPTLLQAEIARFLRTAGFTKLALLPPGAGGTPGARCFVFIGSQLMARPFEDDRDVETFTGERVLSYLELRDRAGTVIYRAVLIQGLSSALTEPRVAGALVGPLGP